MKYLLFFLNLILFLFSPFVVKAQTNVSGNQSGTWTLENSPYQVTSQITVPVGQVLTIEPGVEVNFQGHYKFVVDGKILVNGTSDSMVTFTTDNSGIGWGGIRFDTNSQISVFNYCKFEYGKATGSYPDMHGGAVMLKESDAEFYNCIFENNQAIGSGDDGMGGAVYGINTGSETETLTKFIDCTFKGNSCVTEGGAIKFTNDGNTEITRCEFINNTANYGGGAIMFYSAVDVHMTQCLFVNNSATNSGGGAIKTLNPTVTLFFTNCTFYNNSANGAGEGGAVNLAYADATFVNCIIYDNYQQYGDEITIGTNATATINYCDVDMPADATGGNNLDNVNPLFVDVANDDYHLQETSPCIDVGTDVGLSYEGTAPDLGCYEYAVPVGFKDYDLLSFQVVPNPVQNIFLIQNFENISRIKLMDISGKILIDQPVFDSTIDISGVDSGLYILMVQGNNNRMGITKLLKE